MQHVASGGVVGDETPVGHSPDDSTIYILIQGHRVDLTSLAGVPDIVLVPLRPQGVFVIAPEPARVIPAIVWHKENIGRLDERLKRLEPDGILGRQDGVAVHIGNLDLVFDHGANRERANLNAIPAIVCSVVVVGTIVIHRQIGLGYAVHPPLEGDTGDACFVGHPSSDGHGVVGVGVRPGIVLDKVQVRGRVEITVDANDAKPDIEVHDPI